MAYFIENPLYQRYIEGVQKKELVLPNFEKDANGNIIVHYGEVFCRVQNCPKATHLFSSTNNLRTHIVQHKDCHLTSEKGGRVKMQVLDEALDWYRELFTDIDAAKKAAKAIKKETIRKETLKEAAREENVEEISDDSVLSSALSLPELPRKSDGKVHVTNMRKEVKAMGFAIPCKACGTYKECCKSEGGSCEHFYRFNCGDAEETEVDETMVLDQA